MPSIAEAISTAVQQIEAGRFSAAEQLLNQILELKPKNLEALYRLGDLYSKSGRYDQAIDVLRRAILTAPDFAPAYRILGSVLLTQNKKEQAIECFSHALILDSTDVESQSQLAIAREELGEVAQAVICYRRAILLNPNEATNYFRLGEALREQGNLSEAIPCFQQAIHLKSDYVEAICSLGMALQKHNGLEYAVSYFQQALALNSDYAEARFHLGMAWLQLGHLGAGWPDFESRIKVRKLPEFRLPKWDGSPLNGRRLLLYAEQGFRDTIQFIRYAKLVKDSGGQVIVACQPQLVKLLKTYEGIDVLIPQPKTPAEGLPRFDLYLHLLSLPAIFGTTLETIPSQVPYLHADEELVKLWQSRMPPNGDLRVGLAWQGNHSPSNDRNRSVRLEEFEPLGHVQGVTFFSLQMGDGSEQIASMSGRLTVTEVVSKLGTSEDPFTEIAAIMRNLDLVITSDTSVAHLAGAMGIPVWVALSQFPDWRWLHGRDDSPWYPTMRLFRQEVSGDWSSAFRKMAAALRSFGLIEGSTPRPLELNVPELLDK